MVFFKPEVKDFHCTDRPYIKFIFSLQLRNFVIESACAPSANDLGVKFRLTTKTILSLLL